VRTRFQFGKSQPVAGPHPVPAEVPNLPGAELASVYFDRRMAGDFYDCIRVSPHRTLFGLFDVSGGLNDTRAIVAAAQQTFRSVGTELLVPPDINVPDAMINLCVQLNRSILTAAGGVRSCPAFVGCYDEALGLVCYFNAGHTPGLLRDRTGVSELPATGLPLGLFSHMIADASMAALEPGAVLLLVSRGIVEGKRKSEELGLQRVKEVLQHSKATHAKELCESVFAELKQFMHVDPYHDDVTALVLLRYTKS
jgi:serine phosphatase RsbU (regulator of sigma subunit)